MATVEEALKKRDEVESSIRMLLSQLCRETGLVVICDRAETAPGKYGPSAFPKFKITLVSPGSKES